MSKVLLSSSKHKSFLSRDFAHFVEFHTNIKKEKKKYVTNLFSQRHIRKTVVASLILLIWSFINFFFDATFVGIGLLNTAVEGFSILHYIPWFVFVFINIVAKYIFLGWFDVHRDFSVFQKIIASIPAIGVFIFLSQIFSKEKTFLKIIHQYLSYVRKRGGRFILNLLNLNKT